MKETTTPSVPLTPIPFSKNPAHDPWRCTCHECLLVELMWSA